MKKLIPLFLFSGMLLCMHSIAFASSDDVKIKVNGEFLSDAQAVLKDGSTLLPVRSVSTALGCEVVWDNETKTASIDKDGTEVTIAIGDKNISINGKTKAISTPAQIISGRTYVPLRALGEALECDITWVNATKTVEISQMNPSEYKAWYEVDKEGNLHIRTNINSQKWGGYSIAFKHTFTDNSHSWDGQSGEDMVTYYSSSMTAGYEADSVIKKTRVAALLHDCTKKLEMDEQLELCRHYDIPLCELEQKALKLLHSKTGAAIARDVFGVDEEVYSAICWHTTGRAGMTLMEKILYLADYIEPTRDFDGVDELRRACYEDIDAGLEMGLRMTVEEMYQRGNPVHPATLEALDDLKGKKP